MFPAAVIAMRLKFLVFVGIAVCLWAQTPMAASFDCAKARTLTEKLVCADPTLSRLDEQLDDAYEPVLPQFGRLGICHLPQSRLYR